jgi:predicted MFS family arabinose efflux permease
VDKRTVEIGVGGAAVVGVAFGMARYAYGLTLPDVRTEFGLSELLLGLIASGTFAGYLVGLLAVPRLEARRGPRAPTTVGGVCGAVGAATVAIAPSPLVLAVGAVIGGSAAGWVWAPYSDIAKRVAPRRDRPTLLAAITTGTSVGLIGLAAVGFLGSATSWRLAWAGIAVACVGAVVLNRHEVPELGPQEAEDGDGAGDGGDEQSPWRRAMIRPLAYAALYFAATTAYFTYATEAAHTAGLPAGAAPALFAVIGVGGLVGLATGRMAGAVGPTVVGVGSVLVVSGSLVLLGLEDAPRALTLVSAFVFGAGFMVGSSVLAIWTAQAVPDRPTDGFTVALVVGAVVSIATPAAMGALIAAVGLAQTLVLVGVVTVVGAVGLGLVPRGKARDTAEDRSARAAG